VLHGRESAQVKDVKGGKDVKGSKSSDDDQQKSTKKSTKRLT